MKGTNGDAYFLDSARPVFRGYSLPRRSAMRARLRLVSMAYITFRHITVNSLRMALAGIGKGDRGAGARARILEGWAGHLCRSAGVRVSVIGTPPAPGSLVAANHRSYIDIIALGAAAPMTFLAKSEVAAWPLIGRGCRLAGVVFVERENHESRRTSREAIAGALEGGATVTVFPEGTSFEGPGTLPFRKGSFEAAAARGIPVVPAAVEYHDRRCAWVGDDTFFRHFMDIFSRWRVFVTVYFGPPITGGDAVEIRDGARSWIDDKLRLMNYR